MKRKNLNCATDEVVRNFGDQKNRKRKNLNCATDEVVRNFGDQLFSYCLIVFI